jgi:hypothetical protein
MLAAPPQRERGSGRVGEVAGSASRDANPSSVTRRRTVEELTFHRQNNPSLTAYRATVEGFAFALPYLPESGIDDA